MRNRRRLTKAELRAVGASPGLMARKVGPDGRACHTTSWEDLETGGSRDA